MTFTAMSLFDKPDLISSAEDRKERLKKLFSDYPSDVLQIIENMPPSSLYENAIHDISVEERWSDGPVVLIGDAAHAMTPGIGQGANQGLEDACELAGLLAPALLTKRSSDFSLVLEQFWQSRIDRVTEIHAASRAKSESNNQSSSNKGSNPGMDNQKSFKDRIYQWKPTSVLEQAE